MSEIILQGSFLNLFGVGTLITGEPGIGKSELALSLLDRKHQLIADDATHFTVVDGVILGQNPIKHHFIAIRGLGIMDVAQLFGHNSIEHSFPLGMIIELDARPIDDFHILLEGRQSTKDVLGSLIPCITIPIIRPRPLEVLIEAIVKNHIQNHNKEDLPVSKLATFLRERLDS